LTIEEEVSTAILNTNLKLHEFSPFLADGNNRDVGQNSRKTELTYQSSGKRFLMRDGKRIVEEKVNQKDSKTINMSKDFKQKHLLQEYDWENVIQIFRERQNNEYFVSMTNTMIVDNAKFRQSLENLSLQTTSPILKYLDVVEVSTYSFQLGVADVKLSCSRPGVIGHLSRIEWKGPSLYTNYKGDPPFIYLTSFDLNHSNDLKGFRNEEEYRGLYLLKTH